MPEVLAAEDRLCLLLARGRFSDDVARRAVGMLEAGLRYDVLLERARTHGLVPLVYHRLATLEFSGIPQPLSRELKDLFAINAIRNVLLTRELVRVLEQFDAAGVPVITLKGIALAESLYGDSGLRTSADLDILIQPQGVPETLRLLRSSGYSAPFDDPGLIRLFAHHGKDCLLMRTDTRSTYPLQVHCGLICGGPAERRLLEEIWSDPARKPFHGALAYAMTPEWEFLYLAAHVARHGLYPFKWLVDLDWICVRGELDWKKVQEKAARLGWDSAVRSCFAACAALLETPVPEPFAAATRPLAPAEIRALGPGPLDLARGTLFPLRLLPTVSQKLQFLGSRLFVPNVADCEFFHLPPALFFLYYFLRPWRLLATAAGWVGAAAAARLRRHTGRGREGAPRLQGQKVD